ncbi:Zinc carboxypeptidase family protein [Cryptosporidium felis]|nr:Zinc carboxypeptidase family protein [Cryptosporidium felis]
MLEPYQDKSAYAMTLIGYFDGSKMSEPKIFEGRIWGEIVRPKGEGFGWDPIFKPDGHSRSSSLLEYFSSTGNVNRTHLVEMTKNPILYLILILTYLSGELGRAFGLQTFESYIRSLLGLRPREPPQEESSKFRYKSYSEHLQSFRDLETKCNEVVQIFRYQSKEGLDCGGNDCEYLHIKLGIPGSRAPNLLVLAGIHGDEPLGVEISAEFAHSICNEYLKGNLSIRYLLRTRNFWVIPISNPWGFYHGKRSEKSVDVNRDFPSESGENCLQSESSRMIYDLFGSQSFVLVATLHGGARSISYGNGYFATRDEEKTLEFIAKDLQVSAGKVAGTEGKSDYLHYSQIGVISKTVYPVKGGFEDWSFFGYNVTSPNLLCSDYVTSRKRANSGGSLTFLVETDTLKKPHEDSLGSRNDLFGLTDLDKLSIQPSHITRNVRMLTKLAEYAYPDVIFFNHPPEKVFYGQTFVLYIAVIGCYSFSNLRLKLSNVLEKELGSSIYLDFVVNEGREGLQSSIYYRRCSSIFLNNHELDGIFSSNPPYSFGSNCKDSNLLNKIISRNFRAKNKCKSNFQFSKFKPTKLSIRIPTEAILLEAFQKQLQDFRLEIEAEFDRELTQPLTSSNPELLEKFTQLRSSKNGNRLSRPEKVSWTVDSSPQTESGFKIQILRPQELLQIEFSSCSFENRTSPSWLRPCRALKDFFRNFGDPSPNSGAFPADLLPILKYVQSSSLELKSSKTFKENLNLLRSVSTNHLTGSLYVIPTEARTSLISKAASELRSGDSGDLLKDGFPSLIGDPDKISATLPYFNNITLEISISMSDFPDSKGNYVILKFPEFLNLLDENLSNYSLIERRLLLQDQTNSIAVISVEDFSNSRTKEGSPFQTTKAISRHRVYEMITNTQTLRAPVFSGDGEKVMNMMEEYTIILRYYRQNLASIALGKIYIDNYLRNSLGKSDLQVSGDSGPRLSREDLEQELGQDTRDKETGISLFEQLSIWWYNDSKDYVDFRLVFVFSGIMLLCFPILVFLSRFCKGYKYIPLGSIRLEFNKRFRTNSKIFAIDFSSEEESKGFPRNETNELSEGRKRRRLQTRRKRSSSELEDSTLGNDYFSNRNRISRQKPNASSFEDLEGSGFPGGPWKSRTSQVSPVESPISLESALPRPSLSSPSSSFGDFKSRINTMKELELIEIERRMEIEFPQPMGKQIPIGTDQGFDLNSSSGSEN